MFRVAFDPSLPVQVSATPSVDDDGRPCLELGSVRLYAGDAVPWRQLGIGEHTLFELWRAGLVAHPLEQSAADESRVVVKVAPSETVAVRTPEQQRAGRRR